MSMNNDESNDMNRNFSVFMLLLINVLFTACSSIEVSQTYDPEAEFSSYKTFKWLSENSISPYDPRAGNNIRHQIKQELASGMAARGLALKENGQTDFVVAFYVSVEQKLTGITIDNLSYIPDWHGYGTRDLPSYQHYNKGTLVVDFIDPQTNKPTWRGTAVGVVGDDAQEIRSKIKEAVKKVLGQFPPAHP